jgi:UDP-GlcNAc:undecaprenyl-phosphate GlcNAc-1-phosphate transferase
VGHPVPFLISLALGLVLTPVARRSGLRLGLVDRPGRDELKIHDEPVPLLGGAAALTAAFVALAVLGERLPWGIPAGAGVALAVGLLDDRRPLSPILRVAMIGVVGAIVALGGVGLEGPGVAGAVGVIVLVLACANAVNITDGQDGLAGGLACLAGLGLAWILALHGDGAGASLGLAMGGGLVAFLLWNRPPASIFLGDGGAYAVGALLGVMAARAVEVAGLAGLFAAGAALGLFAFEVAFSVGRRLGAGSRITGGDRLHSYDLVASRWGRTGSTLAFWSIGALCAVGAALIAELPAWAGAAMISAGIPPAAWCAIWLWRGRPAGRGRARAESADNEPLRPHLDGPG